MKQKGVFIIYPTHGEQQQNEIKTIRKRVLELKLSDEDVKRISEKAGAVGLSVAELIENFIGDLVCGTYSNGSDERMYADGSPAHKNTLQIQKQNLEGIFRERKIARQRTVFFFREVLLYKLWPRMLF